MISDERIMGFVEGEGCFCIGIQKEIDRRPRKKGKRNNRKKPAILFKVRPSFRITAVEAENRILYAIKERLGVGNVYTQPRAGNLRNASHYYVQTLKDLGKIVLFFKNKEFYTSKAESFKLWLECLEIMRKKGHLTKEGLLRICEIRDKMNPRIGGKKSRSLELIKHLLEVKPEHIVAHANQKLIHNQNPGGLDLSKWYQKRKGKHELEKIVKLPENPLTATLHSQTAK